MLKTFSFGIVRAEVMLPVNEAMRSEDNDNKMSILLSLLQRLR